MATVTCSPAAWGAVSFEQVLDDVAGAGYTGVELHAPAIERFGRQPGQLRALLDDRTLSASGAPLTGLFFDKDELKEEFERLRRLADFVSEVTTNGLVVLRTRPHPARRDMIAGEPPLLPLSRDRLERLCDTLNQCGDRSREFGLKAAFQNRVGTYVETPDEYEFVVERTEPELVWLAPDLGHWAYAGGNPGALLRTYGARVACPRLKGFDAAALGHVTEGRQGLREFVAMGGFAEVGQGSLDLAVTLQPLVTQAYSGWVCVDLEGAQRAAKEAATASRQWLGECCHW